MKSRESLANLLHFPEKLTGSACTFVRFRGLLGLEVSLKLLRVFGRRACLVSGVNDDDECMRSDQGLGFKRSTASHGPVSLISVPPSSVQYSNVQHCILSSVIIAASHV